MKTDAINEYFEELQTKAKYDFKCQVRTHLGKIQDYTDQIACLQEARAKEQKALADLEYQEPNFDELLKSV